MLDGDAAGFNEESRHTTLQHRVVSAEAHAQECARALRSYNREVQEARARAERSVLSPISLAAQYQLLRAAA
jgi:F0F1-type ATP synthase membrane subunit b/b'